mgnify:FL=1
MPGSKRQSQLADDRVLRTRVFKLFLKLRAFQLPQSCRVNATLQGSRWRPKPPLGDETISCIDDCLCAPRLSDRRSQPQLRASPLMAIEGASVKISVAVKGEKSKGDPNDANRLTAPKLYGDLGHANPSPGKAEQAVTCRIPEHLFELCVRQAIQTVVLVKKKHAERKSHYASTRGECTRSTCRRGHLIRSEVARSLPSVDGVFVGNIDFVVVVRPRLPSDAAKATQPGLCRANDPYLRTTLATSAGANRANGGFQLPDYFGANSAGIRAQVWFDVVMQLDRCETILHCL